MSRLPGEIKKSYVIIFKLLSFVKLALKTCNPDISNSIMARSFQFGQRIQDGEITLIDMLMVGAQCFINTISGLFVN